MALSAPTQYQKRTAQRRRTSDITRLADQYKKNITSLTGEYESAFAQNQKQNADLMAPFESALKNYREVSLPQYEQAAAVYKQKSEEYQQRLDTYNSAVDRYNQMTDFGYRVGRLYSDPNLYWLPDLANVQDRDPRIRQAQQALDSFGVTRVGATTFRVSDMYEYTPTQSNRGGTYGTLSRRGGPNPGDFTETFTETMPTAPEAPQAPTLAEFDSAPYDTKRAGLETDYKREVSERKSARMAAVSRKSSRPMLQGAA